MARMARTVENEGRYTRSSVAHVKPMVSRASILAKAEIAATKGQLINDHVREYESTNVDNMIKSVMRNHVDSVHDSDKTGIEFDMKIE